MFVDFNGKENGNIKCELEEKPKKRRRNQKENPPALG